MTSPSTVIKRIAYAHFLKLTTRLNLMLPLCTNVILTLMIIFFLYGKFSVFHLPVAEKYFGSEKLLNFFP